MTNATSQRLAAVADQNGWRSNRLRANNGKIAVDYFARGNTLITVRYDTRGHVTEAILGDGSPCTHLGRPHPGKTQSVLDWLHSHSK
jgi:hypothetical protein